MRKILHILILSILVPFSVLALLSPGNDGILQPGILYLDDANVYFTDSNWQLGSNTIRIAKGWFTDLDVSGVFTLGGTVGPGGINLPDNVKAIFGTGNDAAVYYNGTDLIIDPKEVGAGVVNLNGGNFTTTGTLGAGILNTGKIYLNTTSILDGVQAGQATITGHIIPVATGSYNLGSASRRWYGLYTSDLIHTTGTITGMSLTDGTATLSGGNITGMGNITGTDVDISAGTGNFTTTGTLGAGAATVTSLNAGSGAITTSGNISATGAGQFLAGTGTYAYSFTGDPDTGFGTQGVANYLAFIAGGSTKLVISSTGVTFPAGGPIGVYDSTANAATINIWRGLKRNSTNYPSLNQEIVELQGRTWTGTGGTDVDTGSIALVCDENHTATARGTRWEFYTTPNTNSVPALVWTMDSDGTLMSGALGVSAYNILTAGNIGGASLSLVSLTSFISMGNGNTVAALNSGGFGFSNTVSGANSFGFGDTNFVTGVTSMAEGTMNLVSGGSSVGFGESNVVSGNISSGIGSGVRSLKEATHTIGYTNVVNNTPSNFAVGFGAKDFEVRANSARVLGDLFVANKSSVGAELVTNGNFTGSAAGWTLGAGWQYVSNLVRKNADGVGTLAPTVPITIVAGNTYYVKFTISSWTVGSMTPTIGGVTLDTVAASGQYKEVITATTTDNLVFTPNEANSRFYIDTVSVTQITGGNLTALGDLVFAGAGSGLPYGEIYGHDVDEDLVMAAQDTWYQCISFDTNGLNNLTTLDHTNDHITIVKTGVYKLFMNCSVSSATAEDWVISPFKNNGATQFACADVHFTSIAGAKEITASNSCLVSLTAGDTIEVWAMRTTSGAASKTLIINSVGLNLVMIGG